MNIWSHLCDPRRAIHRYFLHFLICGFIPGAFFHDSLFSALKDDLLKHMQISNTLFGFLFSVSSITAVIVGPAGAALSSAGTTRSALGCGFLVFLGSLITYRGILIQNYGVLLFGRFLFWVFLWLLQVVQNILTFQSFAGKQLAIAYGVLILSCRLGGSLGFSTAGWIHEMCSGDVVETMYVSVCCVAASFIMPVCYVLIFENEIATKVKTFFGSEMIDQRAAPDFLAFKRFPKAYWYLWAKIGCCYATVFPFEAFGVSMIKENYGVTLERASLLISVVPTISFGAPLIGLLLKNNAQDNFGKKMLIQCIGFAFKCFGYIMLILNAPCPAVWVAFIGIGFCLCATILWLLTPDVLDPDLEQSGIVWLYVSLGFNMSISSFICGYLRDITNNAVVLLWFFSVSFIGFYTTFDMLRARSKKPERAPLILWKALSQSFTFIPSTLKKPKHITKNPEEVTIPQQIPEQVEEVLPRFYNGCFKPGDQDLENSLEEYPWGSDLDKKQEFMMTDPTDIHLPKEQTEETLSDDGDSDKSSICGPEYDPTIEVFTSQASDNFGTFDRIAINAKMEESYFSHELPDSLVAYAAPYETSQVRYAAYEQRRASTTASEGMGVHEESTDDSKGQI